MIKSHCQQLRKDYAEEEEKGKKLRVEDVCVHECVCECVCVPAHTHVCACTLETKKRHEKKFQTRYSEHDFREHAVVHK